MSTLQLLSQIGVLLFMFVVGVEIDPAHLRRKARAAIAISHFSIIVPFTLGVALAIFLYTPYAPPGVPFYGFALFVGIAMSITAFPVLARILDERHLTHTALGAIAITCAAVDDVTAWTLLAFLVAFVTARGAAATLFVIAVTSVVFVLAMVFVGRPFLQRVLAPKESGPLLTKSQTAIVLAALLTSALITESIGIHALFGAFIAGTVATGSKVSVRCFCCHCSSSTPAFGRKSVCWETWQAGRPAWASSRSRRPGSLEAQRSRRAGRAFDGATRSCLVRS
jgi:Kef-type K+ transport system membrane component KefB